MSTLVTLDPNDARWRALLAQSRACSFHHPAWIGLLQASYGYRAFVAAVPDGAGGVSAGLPIMEVNGVLTGRRWVALPFSDHCCPLAGDATALETLVEELVARQADGGAPRIEVRAPLAHAAIRHGSTCLFHSIPLDGEQATWRRVDGMHKGGTRQAERRGVTVLQRTDLEAVCAFYRLHTMTRRRHGVPVQPWSFFQRLGGLLADGHGFVLLAVKDDRPAAGGVFLHWGQTLMFKYSASDPDLLSLRPNDMVYAHAIRWACRNGYQRLDLGKTNAAQEGLCVFKRRWGAEEEPLVYSYIGGGPPRETSEALVGAVGAVIRHAPDWLCRASGELLYRHLG